MNIYEFITRRMVLLAYMATAGALSAVFPAIYAMQSGDGIPLYAILIASSILLFLALAWLVADRTRPRINFGSPRPQDHNAPTALFFLGVLVATGLFLFLTLKHGLFFRRIGFEALVTSSLAMPTYALAIHRTFMETGVTLTCSTLALLISVNLSRWNRFLGVLAFVVVFAIYFSFILLNNRFQSGIFIIGILVTLTYFIGVDRWRTFLALCIGLAALAVVSFQITDNFRNQVSIAGCIDIHALNPLEDTATIYARTAAQNGECRGVRVGDQFGTVWQLSRNAENVSLRAEEIINGGVVRPLANRLNALGLMVEITMPALDMGFGWGRFWVDPVLVNYYALTDPARAANMKLSLRTNPKTFIAYHYLDQRIDDTPSLILTDLYANFGLLGFVIAGLVMGCVLGWTDATLSRGSRAGLVVMAFFLMEKSLYAEKEFLTFALDLVKFSPIPIASALLLWNVSLRSVKKSNLS